MFQTEIQASLAYKFYVQKSEIQATLYRFHTSLDARIDYEFVNRKYSFNFFLAATFYNIDTVMLTDRVFYICRVRDLQQWRRRSYCSRNFPGRSSISNSPVKTRVML